MKCFILSNYYLNCTTNETCAQIQPIQYEMTDTKNEKDRRGLEQKLKIINIDDINDIKSKLLIILHNIFEQKNMFNKQVNSQEQIEEGEISDDNLQVPQRTIPNPQLLHQKQKTKQKQKKSTGNGNSSSQQSEYIIQQVKIVPSTFPADRKKQRKDLKPQEKSFRYDKKFKNSGSPDNPIYQQSNMMQSPAPTQQPLQNSNPYYPQYPSHPQNNIYQYPNTMPNQQGRFMPMNMNQTGNQQIQSMPIQNIQPVQNMQSLNTGFNQNPYNQYNQRNTNSPAIPGQWQIPQPNSISPVSNMNNIGPVSPNKMMANNMMNQIYGYNVPGQNNYGQFSNQIFNQTAKYGQNYQSQNTQYMQQTSMNPLQGQYQNQQMTNLPMQNMQSQYIGSQYQSTTNMNMNMGSHSNYNYSQNGNMNYNPNPHYNTTAVGNMNYNMGQYEQKRKHQEQEEKRKNKEMANEKKMYQIEKQIKDIMNQNQSNKSTNETMAKQQQGGQILQILEIIRAILSDQLLVEGQKAKNKDRVSRQKSKQKKMEDEKQKDKLTQEQYKQFMKVHENNIQGIFRKISTHKMTGQVMKNKVFEILKLLQLQIIVQKLKEKQIEGLLLENHKKKQIQNIYKNLCQPNNNTNNGNNIVNSEINNKNKKDPRQRVST